MKYKTYSVALQSLRLSILIAVQAELEVQKVEATFPVVRWTVRNPNTRGAEVSVKDRNIFVFMEWINFTTEELLGILEYLETRHADQTSTSGEAVQADGLRNQATASA